MYISISKTANEMGLEAAKFIANKLNAVIFTVSANLVIKLIKLNEHAYRFFCDKKVASCSLVPQLYM